MHAMSSKSIAIMPRQQAEEGHTSAPFQALRKNLRPISFRPSPPVGGHQAVCYGMTGIADGSLCAPYPRPANVPVSWTPLGPNSALSLTTDAPLGAGNPVALTIQNISPHENGVRTCGPQHHQCVPPRSFNFRV